MEIVGYISLFFVGLVLGTMGGGGSILSVPILVYLFSVDVVTASAYSLFVVGITSLVGTLLKLDRKMVNIQTGLTFGIPSLIAIFMTRAWLIPWLPEVIWQVHTLVLTKRAMILGLFAILMILAASALIFRKSSATTKEKHNGSIYLIMIGLLTGLLTGMVGAGGGFLIIPALVYCAGMDFKEAIGTTLLIITFNSLIGFSGHVLNHSINWFFLMSITLLAIGGIVVGTRLTLKVSSQSLRKALGCLVMLMGTGILLREIFW